MLWFWPNIISMGNLRGKFDHIFIVKSTQYQSGASLGLGPGSWAYQGHEGSTWNLSHIQRITFVLKKHALDKFNFPSGPTLKAKVGNACVINIHAFKCHFVCTTQLAVQLTKSDHISHCHTSNWAEIFSTSKTAFQFPIWNCQDSSVSKTNRLLTCWHLPGFLC